MDRTKLDDIFKNKEEESRNKDDVIFKGKKVMKKLMDLTGSVDALEELEEEIKKAPLILVLGDGKHVRLDTVIEDYGVSDIAHHILSHVGDMKSKYKNEINRIVEDLK